MTVIARSTALIFVHPRPLRLGKLYWTDPFGPTQHAPLHVRLHGRGWPVPVTAPFGAAMRDRSFLDGSWARTISEIKKMFVFVFFHCHIGLVVETILFSHGLRFQSRIDRELVSGTFLAANVWRASWWQCAKPCLKVPEAFKPSCQLQVKQRVRSSHLGECLSIWKALDQRLHSDSGIRTNDCGSLV